jgi:hypothetical protein
MLENKCTLVLENCNQERTDDNLFREVDGKRKEKKKTICHLHLKNLMFCWQCFIIYQYSKTNVMHFLFSLLRIKGLYIFRALLAHPQEVLHKLHLVYWVSVMSVGCTLIEVGLHKRHLVYCVRVMSVGCTRTLCSDSLG